MKEIFLEATSNVKNEIKAEKTYKLFNILMVVFYVLSGLWIFLLIFLDVRFLQNMEILPAILLLFLIAVLPFLVLLASAIIFGLVKKYFYTEFDYEQVNDTFTISKVIFNAKRKRLLKFCSKEIEKIGRVGSETYIVYKSIDKIKIINSIGSGKDFENKNYYYVVFNNANGKYLVKLDCNETFIKSLINYSNKLLVEKDF